MKKLSIILCLLALTLGVNAQKENPNYNAELAESLKGNDNGMKKYVFAILKTGSNTTTDKAVLDSLFTGHMNNIHRLADDGKLVVAGPMGKNEKSYRGIFILNVETIEEAQELLATDPAVKANIFDTEVFTLWCTAALMEIPRIHESLVKYKE